MTTNHTTTGTLIGIRVNVDGSLGDVQIENGSSGDHVTSINTAVGSHTFDVVGLPNGIDVFVDDEGLYRAEYNPVLTEMVREFLGAPLGYRLHGAGVFLGMNDEGDTLSLTFGQPATVAASWFAASPLAFL